MLKLYQYTVDYELVELNPSKSKLAPTAGEDLLNRNYKSVTQLSELTGFTKQTIYNYIHKKMFTEGIHYFKPTPKKLLFKWDAIVEWIENPPCSNIEKVITPPASSTKVHAESRVKNNINI